MKSELTWKSGMTFEGQSRGHRYTLDTADLGGKNLGPTPKEYLIGSILGCSGMDVVALLKKHKIDLQEFHLSGNADPRPNHPKIFNQVDMSFELKIAFKDRAAELPKVLESVELSMTRYCGVSAMVNPTSPIFYTVVINGEVEGRGRALFEI